MPVLGWQMLRHSGDADSLNQRMTGNLATLMENHQAIAVDPYIHQQMDVLKRYRVVVNAVLQVIVTGHPDLLAPLAIGIRI